jgi:hypothetical protein
MDPPAAKENRASIADSACSPLAQAPLSNLGAGRGDDDCSCAFVVTAPTVAMPSLMAEHDRGDDEFEQVERVK